MKIQKLKKKLDFIFVNHFLDKNTLFIFEYVNKTESIAYKHLNKNLICSLNLLNTFSYKYPLYLKTNEVNSNLKNIISIKSNTFFFKSYKLFEDCSKTFLIRFQKFLYYQLLFIFVLLRKKKELLRG